MLDTVMVGVPVSLSLGELARRGWSTTVRTRQDGFRASADVVTPEGVRAKYFGGIGWLSCEVSLPHLVLGDNSRLLDWRGCLEGLERVQASASDAVGAALPDVSTWRLSRLDAVAAWPVEPSVYVAALRLSRLPRTEPRCYDGSVSWMSMRGGACRGRGYDKRRESRRPDVELPFRLERQVRRPGRIRERVAGGRLPSLVGELRPEQAVGLVVNMMQALGLDKPIPSVLEARRLLVECHGSRRGRNLHRILRELQDFGGVWPSDIAASTRRRCESQLAAAGVRALSLADALPALPVPALSP